jgi:hypothetical protein
MPSTSAPAAGPIGIPGRSPSRQAIPGRVWTRPSRKDSAALPGRVHSPACWRSSAACATARRYSTSPRSRFWHGRTRTAGVPELGPQGIPAPSRTRRQKPGMRSRWPWPSGDAACRAAPRCPLAGRTPRRAQPGRPAPAIPGTNSRLGQGPPDPIKNQGRAAAVAAAKYS